MQTVHVRARPGGALRSVGAVFLAAALPGCALTPEGYNEARRHVEKAGEPYGAPFVARSLPDLPERPEWSDVLRRAFLANGDLEAAYFDWKAAVERIEVASAWPNSRLMLGYSYVFSGGDMKAWDRSTFAFSPDSMESLLWPTKAAQRGKVALAEARAAGARFCAAKFDLQKRVLSAWAEFALLGERRRVSREWRDLAQMALDASRARVRAGGMQQDLLRAEVELQTAENELKTVEAEVRAARAALNGMLAREPDAGLEPPAPMPPARVLPADDATLLAVAVEQNPELEALARQVEGRSDALERARMEWLPDINPTFAFTGSVAQALGAAIMLPTTIKEIEGGIKEAGAMLRGAEAMLRQGKRDRAASFVAALVSLRNAERQAALFESRIIPAAEGIVAISRQSYAAGAATYLDMIDAQRMLLEARLVVAEARAMRETRLAELEALMGTDVETLEGRDGAATKENAEVTEVAQRVQRGLAQGDQR
jgi:outer membrane protein TolC